MADTAETLDFHQTLDVQRDLLAEIALDAAFLLDHLADLVQLILIQGRELDEGVDAGLGQNGQRAGIADAVDVREGDTSLLVSGQIDASNTGHGVTFRWGSHRAYMSLPESGVLGERLTWATALLMAPASSGFNARLDFGELARWGRMGTPGTSPDAACAWQKPSR